MKHVRPRALLTALGSAGLLAACGLFVSSCLEVTLTTGTDQLPDLPPGAFCFDPQPNQIRMRFEPNLLVTAPGQKRHARLVVDPDFCGDVTIGFDSSDGEVIAAPGSASIGFGSPTIELELDPKAMGAGRITATLVASDGSLVTAGLDVDAVPAELESCSGGPVQGQIPAGGSLGGIAGATLTLPEGASAPNGGSFLWSVGTFDASMACADDIVPAGYRALGPAIEFGPGDATFPREIPMSIPINPALLREPARLRHLRVAYSGPAFKAPRSIPVSDPRLTKIDDRWALTFKMPRLGRYQAIVKSDAGLKTRSRRITHRAVFGVSMGGAGAAQFGLRHHQLFDVVAGMGGPVDWTWLVDHLEQNQLGGFRPIAPGTKLEDIPLEKATCSDDTQCQPDERCLGVVMDPATDGRCTFMRPTDEVYEHASSFNNWWYEIPRIGNGGDFTRPEYIQIFRDLALTFGNPIGYNPLALNLPAGVDPEHAAQTGNRPDGECKVWVKPYDGPDEDIQSQLFNECPVERCKHTQVLENYYDDEYNPDGTFPVITFCDGTPQDETLSPYTNTWKPDTARYPMEVAVAVDYNGNGKRDELEPIIRSGREQWSDWGPDDTPSTLEPGYGPDNLDPAGDDYDPQYNPAGTEGDRRFQPGESFEDTGLDGVYGTSDSPYDFGEGDGEFSVSPGLQRFWDYDPHSIVRQWTDKMPTGPLDDAALSRIDFWTDGGTRDLFNFLLTARHLAGTFHVRDRDTVFLSEFNSAPGLDPSTPDVFNPAHIVWEDLQGVVNLRYGKDEPTDYDVENGSGQHVGTINEIARRLQMALYFIGSRWPDAPRVLVENTVENPAEGIDACEVQGSCGFDFTDSLGRTGPVGITLPPGYGHAELQHQRYPVLYVLHGYGQTPEDLQAAIVFLANWMNGTTDSQHTRLAKAILVYVDGRCRRLDGKAECMRGTFFTDSVREDGAQMEQWWLELMDEIDQRYRTMGEVTVEWTE